MRICWCACAYTCVSVYAHENADTYVCMYADVQCIVCAMHLSLHLAVFVSVRLYVYDMYLRMYVCVHVYVYVRV